MQEKNNNIKSIISYLIISILGGMVGTFIILLYLINRINVDLSFLPIQENIINMAARSPQKIVVEQDAAYDKIIDNIKYGIVDIYDISKKAAPMLGLKDLIGKEQFLGKGIILTTDGWVAFYIKNEQAESLSDLKNFKIVLSEDKRKIYSPVKIKKDNFSGIAFMKISVSGLAVMPLAESKGNNAERVILLGQNGIGIKDINNTVYDGFIGEKRYLKSSEALARLFLVNNDLNDASLVINLKGELAGFMNAANTAIASNHIDKAFKSILKSQEILRPSLGIEYIDLSTVLSDNPNFSQNKGCLIYKIIPDSAAANSGLKKDDIILKVENDELKDNNLPELIQEYDRGTLINFAVLRNGTEILLPVVLK
ncbi:MAG: PDZ domain-containing protein [bacterium]